MERLSIPEELKTEMLTMIDNLWAGNSPYYTLHGGVGDKQKRAAYFLEQLGALRWSGNVLVITVYAPHVREQLLHSTRTWVKANWFPCATIAVATLVGVGTIISSFL